MFWHETFFPLVVENRSVESVKMHFWSAVLAAALSRVATASLQVVPGGTWTTVGFSIFCGTRF